jgi:hypothetical protein
MRGDRGPMWLIIVRENSICSLESDSNLIRNEPIAASAA